MTTPAPRNPEERKRRRLGTVELTAEQPSAIEARRVDRQTPEYQNKVARDIQAYQEEYRPLRDMETNSAIHNAIHLAPLTRNHPDASS
jgi:hypothetical protein